VSLDLILPWPPSVNHYYQPYYSKKTHKLAIRKTAKALAYRNDVYYTVGRQTPITGPVFLHTIANQPSHGRHDLDNLLKGICDSLEYARLYYDDSQIDRILIERGSYVKHGELIVRVGALQNKLLIP
jgi:crossover junction endodeoxyribonuclease RusA